MEAPRQQGWAKACLAVGMCHQLTGIVEMLIDKFVDEARRDYRQR